MKAWMVDVRIGTVGCDRPDVDETELNAMVEAFSRSMVAFLGKKYPLGKGTPSIEFQDIKGKWHRLSGDVQ